MKKVKWSFLPLCAAVLATAGPSAGAGITLVRGVFGAAGGPMASARYTANCTLGQSTPIGPSASGNYALGAGFWYDQVRLPGDANGDCSVNILDLIFIRNALGSDPSSGDNREADVNGDGRINVLDLIFARNSLGRTCGD